MGASTLAARQRRPWQGLRCLSSPAMPVSWCPAPPARSISWFSRLGAGGCQVLEPEDSRRTSVQGPTAIPCAGRQARQSRETDFTAWRVHFHLISQPLASFCIQYILRLFLSRALFKHKQQLPTPTASQSQRNIIEGEHGTTSVGEKSLFLF